MTSTNEFREMDCGDITYNLDEFVTGSSGFKDVLFGYHNGLKREIAIKIFEVSGGTQERAWLEKTIKEEMEHLVKADHENVVRVYGYVKWSFSMGIVMEYCKGGDLETLLVDTSKELGLAVRVRILYEIASAMAFCHNLPDKRLFQQDIKPGNVLLTEELHCKMVDLGSPEITSYSTLATVNLLARTKKERYEFAPYYTAPEKLKDPVNKPNRKHDVYSFAMIIYWVLARKAPYPNLTEKEQKELLAEIKSGKRPDCQEIEDWMQTLIGEEREIVEQLQLLMKQCWDQIATKRPTMNRIKEEIKSYLDKQKTTKLLSQVLTTLTQMDLDEQPQVSEGRRVPLYYFSTRPESFHEHPTPGGTEGRTSKTAECAQEHPLSQQGEIPTSCNQKQQPDGTDEFNQQIQIYVELLGAKKYDEAKMTKQQISTLLEGPPGPTANILKETAKKFQTDGKYLEAILLFSIATDFYAKKSPDLVVAKSVLVSAWEIKGTIELLMYNSELTPMSRNRNIVHEHVIPLMRDMAQQIRDLQINDEIRWESEVRCLHYIEWSQGYIGDLTSREKTITLGLELMETNFGNESSKYRVYGALLNNLGAVCEETSRIKEAIEYYTKAIEVYKTAKDLTEEQRETCIANSVRNLQIISAWYPKHLKEEMKANQSTARLESPYFTGYVDFKPLQTDFYPPKATEVRSCATVSQHHEEKFKHLSLSSQLKTESEQIYSVNTYSQSIGPEGGTLSVCGCQVTIPKGACDRKVTIAITSLDGNVDSKIYQANEVNYLISRLTPMLKCEPDGFRFTKPIEITLPTCYRNVEAFPVSVKIRHKTNDSNWEVLTQCLMDQTTRSFTFQTKHFSIYDVICTVEKFFGLMKETAIILAVSPCAEDIVSEIVAHVFICDNNESAKDVEPLNLVFDMVTLLRNQRQDVQIQVSAGNAVANPDEHITTLVNIRDSWQFRLTRPDGENWKYGITEVKLEISFINSNQPDIVKSVFLEKRHLTPTGPNQVTNIDARGGSLRF